MEFFNEKWFFAILHKLAKFHCQIVFTSQVIQKMCFVFNAWAFDDVITFENLKSQNLIISRTKRFFKVK